MDNGIQFSATFFITEGLNFLTNKEHFLTWEEIQKLHEAGFEIGNHSRFHKNVNHQSKEELLEDLEHINNCFRVYGVSNPESFCYSGYNYGRTAIEVLKELGFLFARRGVEPEFSYDNEGGRGPVYDPAIHNPLLIPTTGVSGPNWAFDDFVWSIEQARNGKIVVLTFHGIPDLEHPWVHTEPEFFDRCLDYLNKKGYTLIALRDLKKYVDPIEGCKIPFN